VASGEWPVALHRALEIPGSHFIGRLAKASPLLQVGRLTQEMKKEECRMQELVEATLRRP
jgi:hypothetical protein